MLTFVSRRCLSRVGGVHSTRLCSSSIPKPPQSPPQTSSPPKPDQSSSPLESSTSKPPQSSPPLEKYINQLTLMGRVGAPPEARGTPSNPLTQFDLATLTRFKQGTATATVWHRVCVFRPSLRDTVMRSVAKGDRVFVQGKLAYQEMPDPANPQGVTRKVIVIANDVEVLSNETPAKES